MMQAVQIRLRQDSELFSKFHGFEFNAENSPLAVMERHDGTGTMVGMDTLQLIHTNYVETQKLGRETPFRMSLLATEHELIGEVAGLLSNLRAQVFLPPEVPNTPTTAFVAAAPSFPKAIEREAAAVTELAMGKPLARNLKTGPVLS